MFKSLPKTAQEFMNLKWGQIEPYYADLETREIDDGNVQQWLTDWTRLIELLQESNTRLWIATTLDTTDTPAIERFHTFLHDVWEKVQTAEQRLKQKLLDSGLEPEGFEIPLRNIRSEAKLFREANVPLFTEEQELDVEYGTIIGAQTIEWEGKELTLPQLKPVYQDTDREVREDAWRQASERQLADRPALNDLWQKYLSIRLKEAENAEYADYRGFRWEQFKRFDYTSEDCATFRDAIEEVVVPAAERIYERRAKNLRIPSVRPWDLDADPLGRPALRPFTNVEVLNAKTEAIFRRVDPQLGDYFGIMRKERLLDLENRKGKAPGGYQSTLAAVKRPFIFMNAVGIHDDVQTLLHEGGHAFHVFETSKLPYFQQLDYGPEIAEVASMSMELLGGSYLSADQGGYYTPQEAARARIEHLEGIIEFWPYMAVVDGFQHWVYTHPEEAADPAQCDAKWAELWGRFMKGQDWSELDDAMMTGWQRKLHIYEIPFYYVDYGLAQMGAVQVWRNSLADKAGAVKQYRYGLSLGGTRRLPELYAAAGAKFAFDAGTLGELVELIEQTIEELEEI